MAPHCPLLTWRHIAPTSLIESMADRQITDNNIDDNKDK